jgi:glycosyltransferase involved in cell wall biosynthesis
MSEQPLVSVLMTAYNRSRFIPDAIRSVLASTMPDFELVIVDDASTDDTVAVARSFERSDPRIRVHVNERNLGDYANRNRAASLARGRYLKYLDSDDVMYPWCLTAMTSAMEAHPEAGFGLSSIQDPSGHYPICIGPRDIYLEHIRGFGHFDRSPGSAIVRRSVFESECGFSGRRLIGDLELWLRLARTQSMVKFPAGLMWTRSHEGRESSSDYAIDYDRMRREVFLEALSHPDCPLSQSEREAFRSAIRKSSLLGRGRRIYTRVKRIFH